MAGVGFVAAGVGGWWILRDPAAFAQWSTGRPSLSAPHISVPGARGQTGKPTGSPAKAPTGGASGVVPNGNVTGGSNGTNVTGSNVTGGSNGTPNGTSGGNLVPGGSSPSATSHTQPASTPSQTSSGQPSQTSSVSASQIQALVEKWDSPETEIPDQASIVAPIIKQNPQLPNGCEVTSLAMLLGYLHHPVSKMTLAKEQPFDKTPEVKNSSGQIVKWGNPNVGFVGSPYVWVAGYGIFHGPIVKLINEIMPGQAVDLTHHSFRSVLAAVASGHPVMAWDTADFKPTNAWVTWQTPEGPIKVTLQEHCVLIVGYDKDHIYVNNPLTGIQAQKVDRKAFIEAWHQLGDQAVTILPSSN